MEATETLVINGLDKKLLDTLTALAQARGWTLEEQAREALVKAADPPKRGWQDDPDLLPPHVVAERVAHADAIAARCKPMDVDIVALIREDRDSR